MDYDGLGDYGPMDDEPDTEVVEEVFAHLIFYEHYEDEEPKVVSMEEPWRSARSTSKPATGWIASRVKARARRARARARAIRGRTKPARDIFLEAVEVDICNTCAFCKKRGMVVL